MVQNISQFFQTIAKKHLFIYPLCLLLLVSPFLHGLYYEQDFLHYFFFLALVFVISLIEQIKHKELGLFNHPLDWAMLALLLSFVLSLISAVSIRSAVVGVMRFSSYVMIFWLCFRLAKQMKGLALFLSILYVSGFCMAVFGLLVDCNVLQYPYMNPGDRITGTFDYANTFGIYVAVISIIGWGLLLYNENIVVRAIFSGANALLIIGMLASLSRGTWVLYPFAVLLFLLLMKKGQRLKSLLVWLSSLIPAFIMARLFLQDTPTPDHVIYLILGFTIAAGLQVGTDRFTELLSQKGLMEQLKRNRRWIQIISVVFILCLVLLYISKFNGISPESPFSRITNITLQDSDLQLRLEFNKDAVKIIKDHPLIGAGPGGWEAVYHKYSSHLYWSDKPHNYFLQVGVECGILGFLALISIWLMFIKLLWDYYKEKHSSNGFCLFWAGATACFLIGAHSIIDFDMSYSAIALLFFGLMGALKGHTFVQPTNIEHKKDLKKKHRNQKQPLTSNAVIPISVALIATLGLLINTASLWAAYNNFNSAQKIMNQDPNQALTLLNRSVQYDALNAAYWSQYASFWAAIAVANQQQHARQQALYAAEKAIELDSYNLKILNGINEVYLKLGDYDRAISLAENIINANPRDPAAYENLANQLVWAGICNLDINQGANARALWTQALLVKDRVPQDMEVPAVGLNYTSGQALLLLGEKAQGEQFLFNILNNQQYFVNSPVIYLQKRNDQLKNYRVEAGIWLAASLELSGNSVEANKILTDIPTSEQEKTRAYIEQIKTRLTKVQSSGN